MQQPPRYPHQASQAPHPAPQVPNHAPHYAPPPHYAQQPPYAQRGPQHPHHPPRPPAGGLGLDVNTLGALAHLCFFVFPVVGPIAIALTSPRGRTVREVASQAAAVQVLVWVGMFAGYVVGTIAVGVALHTMRGRDAETYMPIMAMLPICTAMLVWSLGLWGSIKGASASSRGQVWRLPLFGRLADAALG